METSQQMTTILHSMSVVDVSKMLFFQNPVRKEISDLAYLSRNTLGTRAQLTSDTDYVTANNGYFRITGNNTSSLCIGFVDGKELLDTNYQNACAVYVNKGTTLKVTGAGSGFFYPMT